MPVQTRPLCTQQKTSLLKCKDNILCLSMEASSFSLACMYSYSKTFDKGSPADQAGQEHVHTVQDKALSDLKRVT